MGYGSRKGHRKGKEQEDDRLVRTQELDDRNAASAASTTTNATIVDFCLSLYLRGIITPVEDWLRSLGCFINFSRYLSCLFRHGKALLHHTLSLALNELFYFKQFMQNIQYCLTYIAEDRHDHVFGNFDTTEVRNECKKHNIHNFELKNIIAFVTVVWYNDTRVVFVWRL